MQNQSKFLSSANYCWLSILLLFAGFFQSPASVSAQACGVGNACLTTPGVQWKCITQTASFTALVGQNLLLPPAQAATTPQYLVVSSTMTLTAIYASYTFAPGSEIVFTSTGAISTQANTTLVVDGAYLHGCTALWNGITVAANGNIRVSNSRIEDAKIGVFVQGSALSETGTGVAVTGSTFRKNRLGLFLGQEASNSTPVKINLLTSGITGNTFDGIDTLLDNTSGNPKRPVGGIRILRSVPLTIGDVSLSTNIFTNFVNTSAINDLAPSMLNNKYPFSCFGILAENSDCTVQNCKFSFLLQGVAVRLTNPSSTNTLYVQGLGKNLANPTFSRVGVGILTDYGNLFASQASFDLVYNGIIGLSASDVSGSSYDISNLTLSGFINSGIALQQPDGSNILQTNINGLKINNCEFIDWYFNPDSRIGIKISSNVTSVLRNTVIKDNIFRWRNTLHSGVTNPILKTNCIGIKGQVKGQNISAPVIEYNTILDETTSIPFNGTVKTGMLISNSQGIIIQNNRITGANVAVAESSTKGIQIFNSDRCLIKCNSLHTLNTGVLFGGQNCDNTNFISNKMRENTVGLRLGGDVVTGKQIAKNNRFENNTAWDGQFDYSGFNPSDPGHVLFIKLSEHQLNDPNFSSAYWANPRSLNVGLSADNSSIWFSNNPSLPAPPTVVLCPVRPAEPPCCIGQFSAAGEAVMADSFPAYRNFPASAWDASFVLYEQMEDENNLIAKSEKSQRFHTKHQDGTLGQLYAAYRLIKQHTLMDGEEQRQMDNHRQEVQDITDTLLLLDKQFIKGLGVDQANALKQQRDAMLLKMEELKDKISSKYKLLQSTKQQGMKQQLSRLQRLSVTTVWEQNMLDVLRIQLDNLTDPKPLGEQELKHLTEIANQCRYSGGWGVELARKMLPEKTYKDDCVQEREQTSPQNTSVATEIRVYPNPAKDQITVALPVGISNGIAVLTDMTGRIWNTTRLNADVTVMDTNQLPSGLYIIQVQSEGKKIDPFKIQVVH